MSLQDLHTVLKRFGEPGELSHFLGPRSASFQQLLQQWPTIVGAALALHTRPHRLDRQVLKVATSSAVWAQNLQFERHRLLTKITDQFDLVLKDIQFSTAYWQLPHASNGSLSSFQEKQIWQDHPSRVPVSSIHVSSIPVSSIPVTSSSSPPALREQFVAWATACQVRDRSLPRCPRCQSPTPPGELKRWKMCSFCLSQRCHRS